MVNLEPLADLGAARRLRFVAVDPVGDDLRVRLRPQTGS
jgi:hypothetical protein